MTDKELIEELTNKGYKVYNRTNYYKIYQDNNYVGSVSRNNLYKMDSSFGPLVGTEREVKELYEILSRYTETPIEQRREPKYYKYKLKEIVPGDRRGEELRWLNKVISTGEFFLSSDIEENGAKVIFSEYDDDIKKIDFSLFEKIEVERG